tara:strand:+ start:102 stop:887 length:786 start_codon:yes stop_codon:yes gene_type:complete
MIDTILPISGLFDFSGKTVLITGATGEIGAAIAKRFGEAGASLILHARKNSLALAELTTELKAQRRTSVWQIYSDLSDDGECQSMFQNLNAEGKIVDILINNAALQPVEMITELTAIGLQEMLSVNMRAPMLLTRDFAKTKGIGGAVLNICSIEALTPAIGHSHYAATKAGLLQFTRVAALELGVKNIRVNAICPGLINRDGLSTDWPEGFQSWQAKVPLGRIGKATDIANAALYLASDAASFVTGACLTVDGGMDCVPGW